MQVSKVEQEEGAYGARDTLSVFDRIDRQSKYAARELSGLAEARRRALQNGTRRWHVGRGRHGIRSGVGVPGVVAPGTRNRDPLGTALGHMQAQEGGGRRSSRPAGLGVGSPKGGSKPWAGAVEDTRTAAETGLAEPEADSHRLHAADHPVEWRDNCVLRQQVVSVCRVRG